MELNEEHQKCHCKVIVDPCVIRASMDPANLYIFTGWVDGVLSARNRPLILGQKVSPWDKVDPSKHLCIDFKRPFISRRRKVDINLSSKIPP